MSANQNQEFQYYVRAEPMFELTSNLEILVNEEVILSSPIVNLVEKELLQKVLKINYSFKDTFTPWAMQLWELYQTIKHGYTYDEDTSYNHILTSIREKYAPKTDKHLRDEFCKIYDKGEEQHLDFKDCLEDFQCEYDAIDLFALLYCWFKMNKTNDRDWIGIPECVKDVDNDRL